MTISSSVRVAGPYTGTGSVSTYPFAFKVFQASDVLVKQTDTSGNITTLALTTNYSVSLSSDQNASPGGSIDLNSPLPNGYTLVISSQVQELQGTSLTNNGGFYPNVMENALDYLTILVQQEQTGINASLQIPLGGSEYDAGGKRIINGADAVGATDFTTQQQVDVKVAAAAGGVLPSSIALVPDLASTATGKGASMIGYLTGTVKSFLDSLQQTGSAAGAALVGFILNAVGAVARTVYDRLLDTVFATDFMTTAQRASVRAGDKTQDVTAAIQAAVNYCVSKGRKLIFPAGVYVMSASVTNTLGAGNLIISGEGRNETIFQATGSTPFATFAFGSATYTSNELLIENVGFVNSNTITGYGWNAVSAQNVGHLALRNNLVSGGSRGFDITAGYACDITDNLVETTYGEGIFLESAAGNGSRVVGNGLFGCGSGGNAFAISVVSADNALIESNDVENGYGGIFMSACNGGKISSNFIEGQTASLIYFGSSSTGIKVSENWIGAGAETIENCSNIQFKNNTFYNNTLTVNSATASGIDMCRNTILGTSSIPTNHYATPAFVNSWVADTTGFGGYLTAPGYRKDSNNIVRIRGAIKSGTAALAFTLPAGYRPKNNLVFCCSGYGLAAPSAVQVTVELSGNVSVGGSVANTSLDGITFEAEA